MIDLNKLEELAPSATIDGPKFSDLLAAWGNADEGDDALAAADALIAHIDAHVAQAVALAREEVASHQQRHLDQLKARIDGFETMFDQLRAERDAAQASAPVAAQQGDGELPALPSFPAGYSRKSDYDPIGGLPLFTTDQMRDYGRLCLAGRQTAPVADGNWPADFRDVIKNAEDVAHQQGRASGIEEAAKVCETQIDPTRPATTSGYAIWHASAIRALNKTGAA